MAGKRSARQMAAGLRHFEAAVRADTSCTPLSICSIQRDDQLLQSLKRRIHQPSMAVELAGSKLSEASVAVSTSQRLAEQVTSGIWLSNQRRDASGQIAMKFCSESQQQWVVNNPSRGLYSTQCSRSYATATRHEARSDESNEVKDVRTYRDDRVAAQQSQSSAQPAEHQTDLPVVHASPATDLQVAEVVKHPALIVTRNIEWGTVIFGFEQQNKYTVLDQDGNVVALLAEDGGGLGKEVGRQLLRTRRSFTATILSPEGKVVLRLRRPAYLINSTIYIENAHEEVIGEVKQRWHMWQRNYDIYLDRRQIAAINSPLLAWEFAVKAEDGGVLALIDRNFQGFGKELFTDAGKYVIHFGDRPQIAAEQVANTVQAAHPDKPRPDVTKLAQLRTDVAVIPTATGNQLEVARPLSVDERTLILATAVSIDFDYFSQHSHGPGLMPFFMPIPMPTPSYPPPEEGGAPDVDPSAGSADPSSEAGPSQAAGERLDNDEGAFGQGDQQFQQPEFDDQDSWGNENAGWEQEEGFGGDGGGEEGGGGLSDLLSGFFNDD